MLPPPPASFSRSPGSRDAAAAEKKRTRQFGPPPNMFGSVRPGSGPPHPLRLGSGRFGSVRDQPPTPVQLGSGPTSPRSPGWRNAAAADKKRTRQFGPPPNMFGSVRPGSGPPPPPSARFGSVRLGSGPPPPPFGSVRLGSGRFGRFGTTPTQFRLCSARVGIKNGTGSMMLILSSAPLRRHVRFYSQVPRRSAQTQSRKASSDSC